MIIHLLVMRLTVDLQMGIIIVVPGVGVVGYKTIAIKFMRFPVDSNH